MERIPDYGGGSLVNLMADLEARLLGSAPSPPLHPDLSSLVPRADTYLLVVFDGLGSVQVASAAELPLYRVADLDTVFPTTTTVALASIATGLPPSQHGLLGYQLWMPELEQVANTIHWTTLWGDALDIDTGSLLPTPNLWERLGAEGADAVIVQPAHFAASPLSLLLYRGARFEGYETLQAAVDVSLAAARHAKRLVLLYLPQVDYAAHVFGQDSVEYGEALGIVEAVWSRISARLPSGAVAVGTSDHGHVDFPPPHQIEIRKADHDGRIFYGDPRVTFVKGEGSSLASRLPARWLVRDEMRHWWGPPPLHESFTGRAPDGVLVAQPDKLLLHRFSDRRLIGGHGGLTEPELRVPLLVAD